MPHKYNWLIVAITYLAISVLCSSTQAQTDRYCGIYSVFGAVTALGHNPDFESLLDTRFVSGFYGSTASDICAAIESLGLCSLVYEDMSIWSLKHCSLPVILHTRSDGQIEFFNHWLVFLGERNGRLRIADGRDGVFEISTAELLAKWDGVGIVVFDQHNLPSPTIGQLESQALIRFACVCIVLIFFLQALIPRLPTKIGYWGKLGLITFLVSGIALIRHYAMADGFLKNTSVLASTLAAGSKLKLGEIDIINADSMNGVVFVDARYSGDAAYGVIRDAINIPVDSTDNELRIAIKTLPKDSRIIVYCQSEDCAFDETVARRLAGAGFTDVRTLQGGWLEWQDYVARRLERSK